MEIDEENREECRACFVRGLYRDLHKKYEDALAKNAELVKLTSEQSAENERLCENNSHGVTDRRQTSAHGLLLFSPNCYS